MSQLACSCESEDEFGIETAYCPYCESCSRCCGCINCDSCNAPVLAVEETFECSLCGEVHCSDCWGAGRLATWCGGCADEREQNPSEIDDEEADGEEDD